MSNLSITKELQKPNPTAIIELFQIDLIENIHYVRLPSGLATVDDTSYFFHAGTNQGLGAIKWTQGDLNNTLRNYIPLPVKAEGFRFGRGQLPRPTLTFSNAYSLITNILAAVNDVSINIAGAIAGNGLINNDLTGARVTRKRTLEKYLPPINYTTVPSYNAFDSTFPEFPQEVYFIDRKSEENSEIVQFELAANFDLAGVKAPRRLVTRDQFPSAGIFKG